MTITVELKADDIRRAVIAYATGLHMDRPARVKHASLYHGQTGFIEKDIRAAVELETIDEPRGAECSGDSANGGTGFRVWTAADPQP